MTIVVDASVALRWGLALSESDRAEKLLLSQDRVIAPDLIISEIANALWKFVIFDKLAADHAMSAVHEVVKGLDELVPTATLRERALAIAIELRHPAYDCFYLALAERAKVHLVTADDRLLRRCDGTAYKKLVRRL